MHRRKQQHTWRLASRAAVGVIAALTSTALLAGCSSAQATGQATGSPSEHASAEQSLKADLTYAVWDQNQVAAIKANLEGFNKLYPDIKVNVDVSAWDAYWTKLQTEASSDTLPDLFWMNGPNFQLYASNGKIAPITDLVQAGKIDPANYSKALNDLYSYQGVQYGVPKDFDTVAIWLNKSLFEKAGVALPGQDWTWDDFKKTCAELTAKLKSGGGYAAAGNLGGGQVTYYDTIFQAGGNVISSDLTKSEYDTPAAQEGVKFWTDLIASGGSPSVQQLTDTAADKWYTDGKLAMLFNGSWFAPALKGTAQESDTVVYPLPRGKEQATVIHGVTNAVAASSKNLQAAQALQVYLAGKEAQQQQGDLGAVIPAYNGTQAAYVKSLPDANLQVFIDAVDYARPLPISRNTSAWNALESKLLPAAFDGSRTVPDVLGELATGMNSALSKE